MPQEMQVLEKYIGDVAATEHHFHFSHEIIFVVDGWMEMEIEGELIQINANQVCIVCMTEQHRLVRLSSRCHRIILRFSNTLLVESIGNRVLGSVFLGQRLVGAKVFSIPQTETDVLRSCFGRMIHELEDQLPLYMESCKVLLHQVLIALYRIDGRFFADTANDLRSRIVDVQYFIAAHYAQPVTLEMLAAECGMSSWYLSRQFKEVVGMGVREYCTKIRFAEAKRLLCSTAYPVAIVCEMVGMPDCNNFIRAFRHEEGLTPLQYRKMGGPRKDPAVQ